MSKVKLGLLLMAGLLLIGAQDVAGQNRKKKRAKGKVTKAQKGMQRLSVRQWGGQGIGMSLNEAGGYDVEFDCAQGAIKGPIMLDGNGKFRVEGTYKQERPGPVRMDDPDQTVAVIYSGEVNSQSMTLTIKSKEGKEFVSSITLRANVSGRIVKCL